MNLRQTRAALIMILLWTLGFSVLGVLLALGLWGFSNKPHLHELVNLLKALPVAFAGLGAVAGTGFTAFMAWRGSREMEKVAVLPIIIRWFLVGAVVGVAGFVGLIVAQGFPIPRYSLLPLLVPGLIAGTFSALVGTGIVVAARRGRQIGSGEVERKSLP